MANRFPDNARVVFIGDSITAVGTWIAHIYDYYLRNLPGCGIRMYNAGISGGSAKSALMYLEDNGLNYRPTHAVIMLGMNDVNRDLYSVNEAGSHITPDVNRWQEALDRYEAGMRELAGRLQAQGIAMTFLAPTGYDESADVRTLDKVGCDAALEYAGEFCRRLAGETGSEFINLHAPMRLFNAARSYTGADRVHPTEEGHVLMAYLFLAAQGLLPELRITALDSLPAPDDLLPANKARFEAEKDVRLLWNVEWLILQNHPKDDAARSAYMQAYQTDAPYFIALKEGWLRLHGSEDGLIARELECVEACLRG